MKSLEAKVGAFVSRLRRDSGCDDLLVSIAQFNGAHVPYRSYLEDAAGMEPGTAVLFGGITVGKIEAVKPDKDDPTRIEISL